MSTNLPSAPPWILQVLQPDHHPLAWQKVLTDTVVQPKMKPKSIQKLFGDHESKHRRCYPLAVPVTKHWRNCTLFPGELVESFLLDKTIHSVSLWAGFVAVRTAAQTETNINSQRVATVWIIWNIVSNRFNQPVCATNNVLNTGSPLQIPHQKKHGNSRIQNVTFCEELHFIPWMESRHPFPGAS